MLQSRDVGVLYITKIPGVAKVNNTEVVVSNQSNGHDFDMFLIAPSQILFSSA